MEKVVLDSDIRYIDDRGNLLKSRAELSISKLLSFLGENFEHDIKVRFPDNSYATVDFKVGNKFIEVVDSDNDVEKFKRICKDAPEISIIAVGHSNPWIIQNGTISIDRHTIRELEISEGFFTSVL